MCNIVRIPNRVNDCLNNTICAILYVFLLYIYICRCVYVCMCVYLYVYICVCIYMYVWVCMYRFICIILRSGFFLALFPFLFCVPYSCLPTVSLEVDVQTLKPPGAKPRTGKYVRVGYKKKVYTAPSWATWCCTCK